MSHMELPYDYRKSILQFIEHICPGAALEPDDGGNRYD